MLVLKKIIFEEMFILLQHTCIASIIKQEIKPKYMVVYAIVNNMGFTYTVFMFLKNL